MSIISITVYLIMQRPKGDLKVISYTALIITISVLVYLIAIPRVQYWIANAPISRETAIKLINNCSVESLMRGGSENDNTTIKVKSETPPYQYKNIAAKDFGAVRDAVLAARRYCGHITVFDRLSNNQVVYINVDQATNLLNNCMMEEVWHRGNSTYPEWGWAEGSPTGILLAYKETPTFMYIEDPLLLTMLPTAREAQKKCPYLRL